MSTNEPRDDEYPERIDPKIHRRLLRFLNEARRPEELMIAPHERRVAFEEAEHMEHRPPPDGGRVPLMERELAREILDVREREAPLYGFGHIREVLEIHPRLAELLRRLLAAFDAPVYGRWDELYPMEVGGTTFAMEHAALLRTSEVIFLADGTDTLLWDPSDETTPQFTLLSGMASGLAANLVCCGHSFLSDGQLLAAGGGGLGPGNPTSNQAWKFDPVARKWSKTAGDMSTDRWYPTVLTLGDEAGPTGKSGRVLVASGKLGATTPPSIDVYSEATDSFATATVAGAGKTFRQTYPGLHLLPGGEVFYAPTGFGNCGTASVYSLSDRASYFTFATPGGTSGGWTDVADPLNRTKGMSALLLQPTYPFVQVFVVGGGDAATSKTAQLINLSTLSPAWSGPIGIPDGRSRVNVNVVLLPDGSALLCGGLETPPYTSWRYDPASPAPWAEADEVNVPRHYHSGALLLPSGKVMVAGGAANGGCTVSVQNTIEVFSPPYLFNSDGTLAPRPTIATIDGIALTPASPSVIHHGALFTIGTPEADEVAKVVLVRPTAVTHQTDTEQRVVPCTFARTGSDTISARAPDGIHPHALAPRGYYMLFVLNGDGVPSEGAFIHLH